MTNLLSFVEEFQLTSTIGKVSIPFARLGCAVCHDELVLLEVFVFKVPLRTCIAGDVDTYSPSQIESTFKT